MSLTEEVKSIIKATVPVLMQYGNEITSCFYLNMFQAHPELLNIFNSSNQSTGRQPRALAQTVLAAAQNIDNLESLTHAVTIIAHKHKSLGVKKEHYPIVGENLLKAIKQVLGDGATDEVLNAWGIYYGALADIFINLEENLYQETEKQEGGWRFTKEFVVDRKEKESNSITSFYFKPIEGGVVPQHKPGQYIVVSTKIPGDENISNRQYSLSDLPNSEYLRISVKREKDHDIQGKISNYLHDHVNVGDKLMIHAPSGEFVLDDDKESPIVLIAGGVGITPLCSMLKYISVNRSEQPVTLVHAVKPKELAFHKEVSELKNKMNLKYHVICREEIEGVEVSHLGRINSEWIGENILDDGAKYYICGPIEFMKDVLGWLKERGVPSNNINYEFFGPFINF